MLVLTGATGFFGSHYLAAYLVQRRHDRVVALGRDSPAVARERLKSALTATRWPIDEQHLRRVKPVQIDLADPGLALDGRVYAALASQTSRLAHLAGLMAFDTSPEELNETNVVGTRHILRLAEAAGRHIRLLHISTAYVAGAGTTGVVREAVKATPGPSLTRYERTKHEAELLVRRYAQRTGRTTVIIRPSVLATDSLRQPSAPRHPLQALGAAARQLQLATARGTQATPFAPTHPVTARVHGSPESSLNILQVEHAAQALVELTDAALPHRAGPEVIHLVHPRGTPVPRLLDALVPQLPCVRLTMAEHLDHPTPLENAMRRLSRGAHLYTHLRHTYDRTNYHRVLWHLPDPPRLTHPYLLAALGTHASPCACRTTNSPPLHRSP
ncbi:SDR family oxidoreductase [Streptomyces sp. PTM05]|uniref:SDR family oxidoreductase n=1 Tax=Streptantibioticus parmotrematis TaxID=2873249 RepID=A0ABS7QT46_9ACTN|nr:SDR family oxidoreductase [Streptantibioticus parmotrematis]MBY8886098.1 SDR family oxidoreductase [Streptantibioticus parmotrematis]